MWQTNKNSLEKTFEFESFKESIDFVNSVASVAETRKHHPKIVVAYDSVTLSLTTHEAQDSITQKDRDLAHEIDDLVQDIEPEDVVAPTPHGRVKMYADGGSRGNPGPSASGFALLGQDDTVLFKSGVYLGITTNNQAEYQALRYGLEAAKERGITEVDVYMDSLLVINQMKGLFKVKNRDLWPIHESIKELARSFRHISYTHVPREKNKIADGEVNTTLDAELKKS